MKTIGDAVLIRADRADEAIRLGLGLVEQVARTRGFPSVRVGINTGPAVQRAGDWYGSGVNIAARVTGMAAGGEVLLSEQTRSAAGDLGEEIELRALGPQSFRNVPEPVPVFRASTTGGPGAPDVDPVCRMAIDSDRAAGRLTYRGRTYRFCSLRCAALFAAAPARYAEDA